MDKDTLITRRAYTKNVPTEFGEFDMYGYGTIDNKEHVVLIKGELKPQGMLCRVHSECLTGEVFGSLRCDCKEQLHIALDLINKEQNGIIVYVRQEGRGIGLIEKIKAYELQRAKGLDTYAANVHLGHQEDARDYELVGQIFQELQITSIRLITNNPDKIDHITRLGITVEERIPVIPQKLNEFNSKYIQTKKEIKNHLL